MFFSGKIYLIHTNYFGTFLGLAYHGFTEENKEMKKNLIKCVVFILIFCILFGGFQSLLQPKWGDNTAGAHETTNAMGFYDEKKDSIDVMFFGSSAMFFAASPMRMFEEYGFTSYVRGSANQLPEMTYYMMEDSFRHQHPKVAVLELGQFLREFNVENDEWIARRSLDYMPLNDIKIDAVANMELGDFTTKLSYLFPLFRYHDRWSELNESDFDYYDWEPHSFFHGQYAGVKVFDYKWKKDFMAYSDGTVPIPDECAESFDKIVKLCRDNNCELVLVKSPRDGWSYERYNTLKALADEYGLVYIDYNLPENIKATGIIDTSDFSYNQWHLRITGAEKMSLHMGRYLTDTYDLPDRREDPDYSGWLVDLEEYNAFKEKHGVRYCSIDIPELVSVSTDGNGISLTWNPVEHADKYAVFRKTPDSSWVTLGYIEGTEYYDTAVEKGTDYIYTVKAISGVIVSYCDAAGLVIKFADPSADEGL